MASARLVTAGDGDTPTFAFGLLLRVVPENEGGRRTALGGGHDPEHRFKYRPNWGLPGQDGEQSAAPVLGFDFEEIAPGDTCLAVIVPLYPQYGWAAVQPGSELRMCEGARICGHGRVLWRRSTTWGMPDADIQRFVQWLGESNEYSEPVGPTG